jgi:hypothetical protein
MKQKFLLILVTTFSLNAQVVRPLIGIGYNRQSQFYNSSYHNIKTGLEINLKKYIKPEIEINYFLGGFGDEVNYNNQNVPINVFSRKFSILNFGFSPKILLFKYDEEFYYFQILPKYNFSKIEVTGDYLIINQNNSSQSVVETEVLKDSKQSIGIGIGIVFTFSKNKKSDALALNLMYQNIDAGSLFSNLKHNNGTINTKDVFSFEAVYYFNLSNKK